MNDDITLRDRAALAALPEILRAVVHRDMAPKHDGDDVALEPFVARAAFDFADSFMAARGLPAPVAPAPAAEQINALIGEPL